MFARHNQGGGARFKVSHEQGSCYPAMGVLESNGGSQTTLGVRIALNLVCFMVFGCRIPDETWKRRKTVHAKEFAFKRGKKNVKKRIIWLLTGVVILAAILWGPIVSNVEQAKYDVVETHGSIEIRDYAPMIVAEVSVPGDREKAISDGFRMIADYIFGNNISSQKVAMTAPVIQQPSEKIAMTAPVTQKSGEGDWVVRFVMPSAYTMQTLPKPNNPDVSLKEIAERRFAVIRFSGLAKSKSLEKQTKELEAFIQSHNLQAISGAIYAFFNPPWTLPFLRRNEVMIEINR